MLKVRGFALFGVLVGLAALGAGPADAQSVTTSSINLTTNTLYSLTTAGPDGWRMWYSADPNGSNYADATGQTFTTTVQADTTGIFDLPQDTSGGSGLANLPFEIDGNAIERSLSLIRPWKVEHYSSRG